MQSTTIEVSIRKSKPSPDPNMGASMQRGGHRFTTNVTALQTDDLSIDQIVEIASEARFNVSAEGPLVAEIEECNRAGHALHVALHTPNQPDDVRSLETALKKSQRKLRDAHERDIAPTGDEA